VALLRPHAGAADPHAAHAHARFNLVTAAKRTVPGGAWAARLLQRRRFARGAARERLALYHEPNFLAFPFDGPTVVTVHDLSWIRYPEAHPGQRVRTMNREMPGVVERATRIITDSSFIRDEVIAQFGVPAARVTAIPLGVEERFRPLSAEECHATLVRHGLRFGEYVLVVGTIEPRKNVATALAAYSRLPEPLRRRYPLAVAGMEGWGPQSVAAQRLGYVPDESFRPSIPARAPSSIRRSTRDSACLRSKPWPAARPSSPRSRLASRWSAAPAFSSAQDDAALRALAGAPGRRRPATAPLRGGPGAGAGVHLGRVRRRNRAEYAGRSSGCDDFRPMKPIYVTLPLLPPLEEFIPYLRQIWDNKRLTNGGPFHQQLEGALAEPRREAHLALRQRTIALVARCRRCASRASDHDAVLVRRDRAFADLERHQPVFADIDPQSSTSIPSASKRHHAAHLGHHARARLWPAVRHAGSSASPTPTGSRSSTMRRTPSARASRGATSSSGATSRC
jgi:hypothetical protein